MLKKSIILLSLVFSQQHLFALCANCKAVAENNGGEFGNGLNSGILYLAIVPYLILVALVFIAFKGKIKKGFRNFINS